MNRHINKYQNLPCLDPVGSALSSYNKKTLVCIRSLDHPEISH